MPRKVLGKTTMAKTTLWTQSPSQGQGVLRVGSSLAGWRLVGRREVPCDDRTETWLGGDFSGSFYKGFCYKAVYNYIRVSLSSRLQSVQEILHLLHVRSSITFNGTWLEPIETRWIRPSETIEELTVMLELYLIKLKQCLFSLQN